MEVSVQAKNNSEYYLLNPNLYSIGLNRECFSKSLFVQWIFYALWHALIVYFIALYCLNLPGVVQADGKDIGFWLAGMLVFGVCIFVANFELAIRFNTHTWQSTVFLIIGPICYFLFYSLLAEVFKGNIDHLFKPTFSICLVWIASFFCIAQTYIFETIYKYFYNKYSSFAA